MIRRCRPSCGTHLQYRCDTLQVLSSATESIHKTIQQWVALAATLHHSQKEAASWPVRGSPTTRALTNLCADSPGMLNVSSSNECSAFDTFRAHLTNHEVDILIVPYYDTQDLSTNSSKLVRELTSFTRKKSADDVERIVRRNIVGRILFVNNQLAHTFEWSPREH